MYITCIYLHLITLPPPPTYGKKTPLNAFIVMVTLNFEANSYYNACNEEPIGRKT